jgi:Cytidylate kinase-like family
LFVGIAAAIMLAYRLTEEVLDNLEQEEHRYRAETEEFIAAAAESGGVILGRGGQVILRGRPGVLHVLLGGPREARIRQGMEIEASTGRPSSGASKPTTGRGPSTSVAPMAWTRWIPTCTTWCSTAPRSASTPASTSSWPPVRHACARRIQPGTADRPRSARQLRGEAPRRALEDLGVGREGVDHVGVRGHRHLGTHA